MNLSAAAILIGFLTCTLVTDALSSCFCYVGAGSGTIARAVPPRLGGHGRDRPTGIEHKQEEGRRMWVRRGGRAKFKMRWRGGRARLTLARLRWGGGLCRVAAA